MTVALLNNRLKIGYSSSTSSRTPTIKDYTRTPLASTPHYKRHNGRLKTRNSRTYFSCTGNSTKRRSPLTRKSLKRPLPYNRNRSSNLLISPSLTQNTPFRPGQEAKNKR